VSGTTAAGRLVLAACGIIVLVGPLVAAAQVARLVPIDWLAWVPLALAVALSWLVLAR
jgi:hypothetical protein